MVKEQKKKKNAAKIEIAAVFNGWATCSILYPCAAQHYFFCIIFPQRFFFKNEPKTSEIFYMYGTTDKICCEKITALFCYV